MIMTAATMATAPTAAPMTSPLDGPILKFELLLLLQLPLVAPQQTRREMARGTAVVGRRRTGDSGSGEAALSDAEAQKGFGLIAGRLCDAARHVNGKENVALRLVLIGSVA